MNSYRLSAQSLARQFRWELWKINYNRAPVIGHDLVDAVFKTRRYLAYPFLVSQFENIGTQPASISALAPRRSMNAKKKSTGPIQRK